MSPWRQVRAIVLLPGTATILVPAILIAGEGARLSWGLEGAVAWLVALLGLVLIAAGLALGGWTASLFARIGHGTPAPWDPPRRLVVEGPYRYMRNPMISGVIAILLGESAILGRPAIPIWAAAFVVLNHAYFVLVEEPSLIRRFGDDYRQYRREVPRWIPRQTPYA
jgi:protein-S-isoprenylcysteine O-methyltransferase Ste14